MAQKKAAYAEYRKVKEDAQELLIAESNLQTLMAAEQKATKERQEQEQQH